MILTSQREPSVGGATLSRLSRGKVFICDLLEDEIRERPGVPVAEWKEWGRSAIPAGKYRIVREDSKRFGPGTLTLADVPGFAHIRIHGGNTSEDTEGCLLPGLRNSKNTVTKSRIHLALLDMIVREAMNAGDEVWIEILNPRKGAPT